VIVVDSSVWIDYFNGVNNAMTDHLDQLLGAEPILVGDLILTEVLQGFRRDADHRAAREAMTVFPVESMVGPARAVRAADNYRLLRSRGVTVRKTIDVLIGTFCLEDSHQLLFNDHDFEPLVEHLGLQRA
jgi:predicted nucleic acid-binding protein